MTAKTKASEAGPFDGLDDETTYEVELLRAVRVGRVMARPGPASTVSLKGKAIKEYGPDVVGRVLPLAQ